MEQTDVFISSKYEFWWEPVRQESYGAIVSSIIAHYYHFVDGCFLFLSDKTRSKITDADIVTKEGAKSNLNSVINFEIFIEDNTGFNILIWLKKSTRKILPSPHILDTIALMGLDMHGNMLRSLNVIQGANVLQISKQPSAHLTRIIDHQICLLVHLNWMSTNTHFLY